MMAARRFLRDVELYVRSGLGVRRLVRNPISLGQALDSVSYHRANREYHFLTVVESAIFGNPRSPYLPLFELAGCELGDVQALVRTAGLEGTLSELRRSGVYISYEEFKGRVPLVRGTKEFAVAPQDFHNPRLRSALMTQSGGTTGIPSEVPVSLGSLAVSAAYEMVAFEAQGFLAYPWVLWKGVMPDPSGINNVLRRAYWGSVPEHWYSPVVGSDQDKRLFKYRVATRLPILMARSVGARIPHPEPLPLDRGDVIAEWVAATIREDGGAVVQTTVSSALRVALSGLERGYDFEGGTFLVSGEPVTPGKENAILATGATLLSNYGLTEMGRIGTGCADASDVTDVHLLEGISAVIEHPTSVPDSELTVPALHVTSLLPSAPMVMLNVEFDDYGLLESRPCECALGQLGERTHFSQIRSSRKLAGEGLTLLGSDILKVLDEVLPAHYGGSPLDYQLCEKEDDVGFTRFVIRVSPRVSVPSESGLIDLVLASLSTDAQRAYTVPVWRQAGTFRVERTEPKWARTGKLQPLDIERNIDT